MTEFPPVSGTEIKFFPRDSPLEKVNMKKLCFVVALAVTLAFFPLIVSAQWVPLNGIASVQKQADGVTFTMQKGTLRLQVCADGIIHVVYAAGASIPDVPQYIVTKTTWAPAQWTMDETDKAVTLTTSKMKASVTRRNGAILFTDAAGNKLFEDGARSLTPVEVNGEKTYHSEVFSGLWDSTEAFYGLGQHQAGVWNYRGETVDLSQENTEIAIPLLVSTNGYGIFWNNPSRSRLNNRFVHWLYHEWRSGRPRRLLLHLWS